MIFIFIFETLLLIQLTFFQVRPVLKKVVSKLKNHGSFFAGKKQKKLFEKRLYGALKAAYLGGQRQFFVDPIKF